MSAGYSRMAGIALGAVVFTLGMGAKPSQAGQTSPGTDRNDPAIVEEIVFHYEALRLIEQDQKQLRRGENKVLGDLWPYSSLEGRISIRVEPDGSVKLNPFRIYRAYNRYIHPALVYRVAIGPKGDVYRLGGFPSHDFNELISTRLMGLKKSRVLESLAAYYRAIEDYEPGALTTRQDVEQAVAAIEASPELGAELRQRLKEQIVTPTLEPTGSEEMVTIIIFDSHSLRTERHTVRVSATGLKIESRDVLLDRFRIVL